ncbi:MAG TPA: lipoyl(octanoyl) transferase LipB [Spirillospora sp.]|nr:lipoyl(octanoyl) transferase LipB [Spirillospora sp.]
MPVCEVWRLGQVAYQTAWDLQAELVQARSADDAPDRLLLLQHPHTFTLGSAGQDNNVLWDAAERQRRGVELFRIDRGGDVTYHGPGQLVGYPILKLPRGDGPGRRLDVRAYLRNIETVIIRTLADYGISGKPVGGLTGVWVDTPRGEEKICAIGVKINVKGVTKHGFALNINTDLTYFGGIIPCGIQDKGVTSMAALLGGTVDERAVTDRLIDHFGAVFGCEMVVAAPIAGLGNR